VTILAPSVRDVEVVAHQCEAARNMQGVRGWRWIEEQRMSLAWGAVVLEDTDVVDAVPRFTSITDPPHGSVLLNMIAAMLELHVMTAAFQPTTSMLSRKYGPRDSTGIPAL
jgi:hypothetical protein